VQSPKNRTIVQLLTMSTTHRTMVMAKTPVAMVMGTMRMALTAGKATTAAAGSISRLMAMEIQTAQILNTDYLQVIENTVNYAHFNSMLQLVMGMENQLGFTEQKDEDGFITQLKEWTVGETYPAPAST